MSKKVALFYPVSIDSKGNYFDITNNLSKAQKECSLLGVSLTKDLNDLRTIRENIINIITTNISN